METIEENTQKEEPVNAGEPCNHKITEEEFRRILFENKGRYAKTAAAIMEKHCLSYSRQAVRIRAAKYAEELAEFIAEARETAENTVLEMMQPDNPGMVRLKAAIYVHSKLYPAPVNSSPAPPTPTPKKEEPDWIDKLEEKNNQQVRVQNMETQAA